MCVCVCISKKETETGRVYWVYVCVRVFIRGRKVAVFSPEYSVEQVVRVNARTCSCLRNISL